MTKSLIARAARKVRQEFTEPALDALLSPVYGAVAGIRTTRPMVALTFDDGPHPYWTDAVLELLGQYNALATFFCVGEAVFRHRTIVEATARAGHAIGSHSLSHVSLTGLSEAAIRHEVADGHAAVADLAAPIFRPPFGHNSPRVARAVRRLGLTNVLWSGHAQDWLQLDTSTVTKNLTHALRPGAIVLLHDTLHTHGPNHNPDRQVLLAALADVLPLAVNTFQFVTVPQLLEHGAHVKAMVDRGRKSPLDGWAPATNH